jgi:hypothetical protein
MKKLLIKYNKKKYKIGKLVRNKKTAVFFFLILVVVSCLLFNAKNVKSVDIDDNYSQYLTNNSVSIQDDNAMLLKSIASSGTNYRNILESNFLYPAKLSSNLFSAIGQESTSYSVGQTYLDNLDNDYNYMLNDNTENIEQQINVDNYNVVNGTKNSYIGQTYLLYPNLDIITEFNVFPSGNHYSTIDDNENTADYISVQIANKVDFFEINNVSLLSNIESIEVSFYSAYGWSPITNSDILVQIYNQTSLIASQTLYWHGLVYIYGWNYVHFNNLNLNQVNLNNLKLKITKILTSSNPIEIASIKVNIHENDDSFYYDSKNVGTYGNYVSEYSFYSDAIGSNPSGWTVREIAGVGIQVISSITNHSKVVEFNEGSGIDYVGMYNDFSVKTSGTIEFWIRTSDNTKYLVVELLDGSNARVVVLIDDGKLKYLNSGSAYVDICSVSSNIWYHLRIDFECGSGAYMSLSADQFHIYLNGVHYGNYGFYTTSTSISRVYFKSSVGESVLFYIDAIDYSWSSGYYLNRNYIDSTNTLSIEKETNINYYNYQNYKPIFYDLKIQISNNISIQNYEVYVFNYDLNKYDKRISVLSKGILYSFKFNESAYFRLNKFKIFINSTNQFPFKSYILSSYLEITYVKINDLGYQYLTQKFLEYDLSSNYLGYFQLEIKLFKTYMLYRYLEISVGYDNYDYGWILYNYSIYNLNLKTLEILGQCRYGYNTLIQRISNIRFDFIFNDFEQNFTILEQNRKGSFLGHKYNFQLNYTTINYNYLNLTGIIGNYSYSCLKGFRCLKGSINEIYNRFFIIPTFNEKISVANLGITSTSVNIENEPPAPAGSQKYWTYTSFRLINGNTIYTEVGNWSIEFKQTKVEQYLAKHYYNEKVIKEASLGSWTFRIGEWRISFNFIRDAIVLILNLVLLFLQYIWFLLIVAINFLIMFIGCYMLAFIWNFLIYWIYIGLIWVVWFLWLCLLALWQILIWLWTYVLYPILEWCYYNLLPAIITAIIIILAFCITCFIFVITLGKTDFWDTYYIVKDILNMVVSLIMEWITLFVDNMFYILIFMLWYLINAVLIYFRYLYSRARGNINRAEQLYYTFQIYIAPIVFIWNLLKKLLETTPQF